MRQQLDDVDAAYTQGYQDGQRDLIRKFKKEARSFKEQKAYIEDLLVDPEKLVELSAKNPKFNSAMTIAVIEMLLEEGQKDKPAVQP